jgi:DNA-binding MarR family transcriptional regulator
MPALMYHLTKISRVATQYRSEQLAPLGLKACHGSYLFAICHCPGITQDQLARRIFINKSNVARQLVALEEAGFVERKPSPEDKRATLVYPTQKALDVLPQIGRIFREWEALVAQDLTEEERALAVKMLAKMEIRAGEWMENH